MFIILFSFVLQVPLDEVFSEWLQQCDGAEETEDKKTMAFTLFHKLGSYEIFPNVPIIQEIVKLFRKSLGWSGLYVKIPSRYTPAYQKLSLALSSLDYSFISSSYLNL